MSEWVSAPWMDAEIVRWGDRPGLFVDGAAPLSPDEAAHFVDAWFGEYDQYKARASSSSSWATICGITPPHTRSESESGER